MNPSEKETFLSASPALSERTERSDPFKPWNDPTTNKRSLSGTKNKKKRRNTSVQKKRKIDSSQTTNSDSVTTKESRLSRSNSRNKNKKATKVNNRRSTFVSPKQHQSKPSKKNNIRLVLIVIVKVQITQQKQTILMNFVPIELLMNFVPIKRSHPKSQQKKKETKKQTKSFIQQEKIMQRFNWYIYRFGGRRRCGGGRR